MLIHLIYLYCFLANVSSIDREKLVSIESDSDNFLMILLEFIVLIFKFNLYECEWVFRCKQVGIYMKANKFLYESEGVLTWK